MKQRKAIFGIFLVLTLLLVSACSKPPASETKAPAPAPSPAAPAAAPEPKTPEEVFAALAKLPEAERHQKLLEGAKKEGKVVVYSALTLDMLEAFKKEFESLYPGVTMEFWQGKSTELVDKAKNEANAGRHLADVFTGGSAAPPLYQAGLIAKHSNVFIPADYPKDFYADWWATADMNAVVIAWNTNLVKDSEAPKTWEDVLDPKWKGKIAIDPTPGTWTGMVKVWGKEKLDRYFTDLLDKNGAMVRESAYIKPEALAAGEYAVLVGALAQFFENAATKGVPVSWVVPDPTVLYPHMTTIAKSAPHPYAAALWMEYATGVKGQQQIANLARLASNPKVKLITPKLNALLESKYLFTATPEIIQENQKAAQDLSAKLVLRK